MAASLHMPPAGFNFIKHRGVHRFIRQQMGWRHGRLASHQSVWTPKKKPQYRKEVKPERARRLDKLEG